MDYLRLINLHHFNKVGMSDARFCPAARLSGTTAGTDTDEAISVVRPAVLRPTPLQPLASQPRHLTVMGISASKSACVENTPVPLWRPRLTRTGVSTLPQREHPTPFLPPPLLFTAPPPSIPLSPTTSGFASSYSTTSGSPNPGYETSGFAASGFATSGFTTPASGFAVSGSSVSGFPASGFAASRFSTSGTTTSGPSSADFAPWLPRNCAGLLTAVMQSQVAAAVAAAASVDRHPGRSPPAAPGPRFDAAPSRLPGPPPISRLSTPPTAGPKRLFSCPQCRYTLIQEKVIVGGGYLSG